jgi:hypothetical protein
MVKKQDVINIVGILSLMVMVSLMFLTAFRDCEYLDKHDNVVTTNCMVVGFNGGHVIEGHTIEK